MHLPYHPKAHLIFPSIPRTAVPTTQLSISNAAIFAEQKNKKKKEEKTKPHRHPRSKPDPQQQKIAPTSTHTVHTEPHAPKTQGTDFTRLCRTKPHGPPRRDGIAEFEEYQRDRGPESKSKKSKRRSRDRTEWSLRSRICTSTYTPNEAK